jgi:hypothetical protein
MLEYIISLFFILLILCSIIKYFTKSSIIEGATGTYQEYADDPLILAKTNAANIDVLKKKIDELSNLAKQTKTNTNNIDENSQALTSLLNSMSPSSEADSQKNQASIDDNPETFNLE